MTAEQFNQTLEALCEARPFKAFRIEFQDGRRLEVDFPVAYRDGVACYLSPRGAPTIFRHNEVNQIIAASANAQ